jgi:hypothetical protein
MTRAESLRLFVTFTKMRHLRLIVMSGNLVARPDMTIVY